MTTSLLSAISVPLKKDQKECERLMWYLSVEVDTQTEPNVFSVGSFQITPAAASSGWNSTAPKCLYISCGIKLKVIVLSLLLLRLPKQDKVVE